MRTILVNLEISPVLDSVLQSALLVARRFGSYIEGLHMRPGQPDIIAAGADGFVAAAPDLVASFEREARDRAERARNVFEEFMAANDLPRATGQPGESAVSADWRIEVTSGHGAIGNIGRVFDLLVVGRPLADSVSPSMAALETALFESGRPLLIAPPDRPTTLGENILITWNCSTETARTVAFQLMAKDALGAHARDELGISEMTLARPVHAAAASALSFAAGAVAPLIVAALAPDGWLTSAVTVSSLAFLAVLGSIGAKAGGAGMWRAAIRVMFWGAVAMAVTAGIGGLIGILV